MATGPLNNKKMATGPLINENMATGPLSEKITTIHDPTAKFTHITSTAKAVLIDPNVPLVSESPSVPNSVPVQDCSAAAPMPPIALPTPTCSTATSSQERLLPATNEPVSIFIDLETTGLHPIQTVQPIQISGRAVLGSLVKTFDKFMLPTVAIDEGASKFSRLFVKEERLVRLMDKIKEEYEELEGVVPIVTGLELFWDWVEEMASMQPSKNVFLVCYSYNKFDLQVLKYNMKREKVEIPSSLGGRLLESEPMDGFQKKLGVKSRRLADVVREVLGREYKLDAHDATHDVKALHLFVKKLADNMGLKLTQVLAMDTRRIWFGL